MRAGTRTWSSFLRLTSCTRGRMCHGPITLALAHRAALLHRVARIVSLVSDGLRLCALDISHIPRPVAAGGRWRREGEGPSAIRCHFGVAIELSLRSRRNGATGFFSWCVSVRASYRCICAARPSSSNTPRSRARRTSARATWQPTALRRTTPNARLQPTTDATLGT